MARVSIPTIVDDLDASTEGVDTYTFALQGVTYEIDLSAPNADKLFALLHPYLQAGRRLPKNSRKSKDKTGGGIGATGRKARRAPRAAADKPTTGAPASRPRGARPNVSEPVTAELRNWWAEKEHELNLPAFRSRGAIPQQVRDAYATAHAHR